jgi:rhodanese-related sulfurtransferase
MVNAQQLLEEARLTTPELTVEDTDRELSEGKIDILLDVRDAAEWQSEHIEGAIHAPRGTLEWLADPTYPKHNPMLAGRTEARIVVLCASGGRSLLAAKALREMGYEDVSSMTGGVLAWKATGLALQTPTPSAAHASYPRPE